MKNTRLIIILLASLLAFSHCKEQPKVKKESVSYKTDESNQDYLKKGLDIALKTKAVLGKNLFTAISKNCTENALQFCSEKAITLTDSMGTLLNANIKRVSDKNRNPNNKANKQELDYINMAKQELAEQGQASPKINIMDHQVVGYYPIVTNAMCLQCHGNKQLDISQPTQLKIDTIYPNDKATGYAVNELRGIWVVAMDK